MNVGTLLAVLVAVFAGPLNWYVAGHLILLSRREPDLRVLRERAIIAVALAIITTVFAVVFLNNELTVRFLDADTTKVVTRTAVLVGSSIPALYWLWIYRNWGTR